MKPAAKIDQVVKWIIEGQSDHAIRESIEEGWPEDNADELIKAANESIEEIGGWDIAAALNVYQKSIEIGDFSQAGRSLKEIERLRNAKSPTEPKPATTTELIDPKRAARDCNQINRAIVDGWDIPPAVMAELPELLAEVARNGDARAKVAAARVLVSMASQNQKSKPAPVKRIKHIHQVNPVTEADIEQRKRQLSERVNRLSDNAGGTGAG